MNANIKKVLYVAGGALVVSSIYGFQKVSKIKNIFDKMDIKPDSFSKFSPDFQNALIRFNLNVKLSNKVSDDLYVTGVSVATLKEIIVFYKGTYIATAKVNIIEISIPGNTDLIIKNIPVEVAGVNVLQNVTSFLNFDFNLITVKGVIRVLNVDYLIGE